MASQKSPSVTSIRLSPELLDLLDHYAATIHVDRSHLARMILEDFFRGQGMEISPQKRRKPVKKRQASDK